MARILLFPILLVFILGSHAFSQDNKVYGVVLNEQKEQIPFVTILEKGQKYSLAGLERLASTLQRPYCTHYTNKTLCSPRNIAYTIQS